jgi:rhodanese-related sulfurtransferase
MTSITIATLPRLTRENLAGLILTTPLIPLSDANTAVVDVRDSDHVGGHILGSIHAPTPTLDWKMPELVRELKDKDKVIFHCALSQQRGPSAALRYIRERERMYPALSEVPAEPSAGNVQEAAVTATEDDKRQLKTGKRQKVYVLDGGFVQWQEKYGKDKTLTDAYDEEVWKYGY